jgi:outer membrane protein OmpA-like peptidoglycan-associated protein
MYHKYLSEIVVPKIPINGLVIIHGHSDIIGDSIYNQKLSLERSNDVRMIMEDALKVAGRSDVTFDVYGFGEDKNEMPYDNKYPEQRFYNRTVIIDIIPAK